MKLDTTKVYVDTGGYVWDYRHGAWGFRDSSRKGLWRTTRDIKRVTEVFGPFEEVPATDVVGGVEGTWLD